MQVRAKMTAMAITPFHSSDPDGVCAEVRMMPVFSDSPENATWSKYTPSGDLRMVITNPAAINTFVVGKCYLVDFSPAE